MSKSHTVTVFECYEYTNEKLEWLINCDSPLVNIKNEGFEIVHGIAHCGTIVKFPGRREPLIVTIADDKISLMFRLKYPNLVPTETIIYSTAHGTDYERN